MIIKHINFIVIRKFRTGKSLFVNWSLLLLLKEKKIKEGNWVSVIQKLWDILKDYIIKYSKIL